MIACKSEIRYLGVQIVSSNSFKCNLQLNRQKFFQAANGVLGKIGVTAPINLILSLIDSFCIPVLFYGLEGVGLSKSQNNCIDFAYSAIFFKLFNVKESMAIKWCQYYTSCLPPSFRLDIRSFNFYNGLIRLKPSLPFSLVNLFGNDELSSLLNRYNPNDSVCWFKSKVWNLFHSSLL